MYGVPAFVRPTRMAPSFPKQPVEGLELSGRAPSTFPPNLDKDMDIVRIFCYESSISSLVALNDRCVIGLCTYRLCYHKLRCIEWLWPRSWQIHVHSPSRARA